MRPIIHKRPQSRLHPFDILVLGVVVALLVALLVLRASRTTQWVTLRMVVTNEDWWWEGAAPQWWYAANLVPGEQARNSLGQTIAEVVNVESFDVGEYRRRVFIDLRIKGTFDEKRGIFLYNYQPLQIGKGLDLTIGKNNVRGIVTTIDSIPQPYNDRTIEVRVSAVQPWVAQLYRAGLEMKDSQGRVLAEILSVSTTPSSVREVVLLGEGTEKTFEGGQFIDVVLRVAIKTFTAGETEHFVDRAAIKVGERIWFQFPSVAVREAEIVRIIE